MNQGLLVKENLEISKVLKNSSMSLRQIIMEDQGFLMHRILMS